MVGTVNKSLITTLLLDTTIFVFKVFPFRQSLDNQSLGIKLTLMKGHTDYTTLIEQLRFYKENE